MIIIPMLHQVKKNILYNYHTMSSEQKSNSVKKITTDLQEMLPSLLKERAISKEVGDKFQCGLKTLHRCFIGILKEKVGSEGAEQGIGEVRELVETLIFAFLETGESSYIRWLNLIISISITDNYQPEQSVYELPKVSDTAVIALSYEPVPAPVITSSDAMQQQEGKANTSTYFKDDDAMIEKYLSDPFQTIKREGMTETQVKLSQLILSHLFDPLSKIKDRISIEGYVQLSILLEGITPAIYSFYLITLFKDLVAQICQKLSPELPSNSRLNSKHINQILYALTKVSSRWESNPKYSDSWEWQIQSRSILCLLNSEISQSKLNGVKLLCECCRRCEYSMVGVDEMEMKRFIEEEGVLGKIYSLENHPEVISKGKDVYEFLSKKTTITKAELTYLLKILDKSHQNVSKSLYLTIQSLGQTNLEFYWKQIMEALISLSKPSSFTEESQQLMETLILVAPISELTFNMACIYKIIGKHYSKLKKHIKEKLVRLYFELFVMGVEENVLDEGNCLNVVVEPCLEVMEGELGILMLETFVKVVRNQGGKPIYKKCKQILNKSIQFLFTKAKIHLQPQSKSLNLTPLIKFLLETYDSNDLPISYDELCILIKQSISFTKFVQYFPKEQQLMVMNTLLSHENKNREQVDNIIGAYALLQGETKEKTLVKIWEWFMGSQRAWEKEVLVRFLAGVKSMEPAQICKYMKEEKDERRKLSYFMMLRETITHADEKGFGKNLPFSYLSKSYATEIKATNSFDVFNPITHTFTAQSYETVAEIISKILAHFKLDITQVMMKINEKSLSVNDLTLKVSQLAPKSESAASPCLSISVFEAYECEWFDKSQLINNKILNEEIVHALREIFTQFTVTGRMHRNDCARLFEKATDTENILETDSRIEHLFAHYSQNSEFLTLEQWISFYQNSSEDNPGLVIDNLKKLGYRHLFKNQSDILAQCNNCGLNAVRDMIVGEIAVDLYPQLFTNYHDPSFNEICIQLLKLLPVHPAISIEPKKGCIDLKSVIQGEVDGDSQKWRWYGLSILSQLETQDQTSLVLGNLVKDYKQENFKPLIQKIFLKDFTRLSSHPQVTNEELTIFKLQTKLIKHFYEKKEEVELPKSIYEQKIKQMKPIGILKQNKSDCLELSYEELENICEIYITQIETISTPDLERDGKKAINDKIQQIDDLLVIYSKDRASLGKPDPQFRVDMNKIFHRVTEIRQLFNKFYLTMSHIQGKIKQCYFEILKGDEECPEYFEVLMKFLEEEDESDARDTQNQSIYEELTAKIQSSIEKSSSLKNSKEKDDLLHSQLSFLISVKIFQPKIPIRRLEHWLPTLTKHHHTNEVNSAAYDLAGIACGVEFNIEMMEEIMRGVVLKKNSVYQDSSNKMGLFNLGATCYINSTLQQLFAIEDFREGILGCENYGEDELYFKYLREMFYFLAYGDRGFYITEDFCLNFQDYAGQPINVREQHDADQFMSSLLDRLERTLEKSENDVNIREMIRNNFCGKLANILTCQSCFTEKSRIEDFYVLSLEIKNHKNLPQCFDKLTQPEVITDYFCQQCDLKVEAIEKKIRIHHVPNYLFIHFQRLVFDLESLSKVKLEHPVDFPLDIDIAQYFPEDIAAEVSAKYSLRGFIVHIGTSDSGHYYSLIKEGQKWTKYDDSRIEEWEWKDWSREKDNAYLLIYEKNQQVSQKEEQKIMKIRNEQLMQKVKDDNQLLVREILFSQNPFSDYLLRTLAKIQVPAQFINCKPNQLHHPFHPDHQALPPQNKNTFQRATDLILTHLHLTAQVRSSGPFLPDFSTEQVKSSVSYLLMLFHICPSLMTGVLEKVMPLTQKNPDKSSIRQMLVHSDQTIRQAYKLLFSKIMSILVSVCPHSLLIPAPKATYPYYAQQILAYLVGSLQESAKNIAKMDEHFQFMVLVAKISPKCLQFFYANNLPQKLIHFITQDSLKKSPSEEDSGSKDQDFPSYNFSPSRKCAAVNQITQLILLTIRNIEDVDFHEREINRRAFISSKWYVNLFKERYDYEQINLILAKSAFGDERFSLELARFALGGVNRFSHSDSYVIAYVHLIQELLALEDGLGEVRLQAMLGVPQLFLNEGDIAQESRYMKYWNNYHEQSDETILPLLELLFINRLQSNYFTLCSTLTLLRLISKNPSVSAYINRIPIPATFSRISEWLSLQIKNGMNEEALGDVNKEAILNEMSMLVNEEEEGGSGVGGYHFQGKIRLVKKCVIMESEDYKVEAEQLEDQSCNKLIKLMFQFPSSIKSSKLTLNSQKHYHFTHYFESGFYQLGLPLPFDCDLTELINIEILEREEVKMEEQKSHQEGQKDANNQEQPVQINNSGNEQIFECPFCTSISFSFASRCPTCGEEWGEMA